MIREITTLTNDDLEIRLTIETLGSVVCGDGTLWCGPTSELEEAILVGPDDEEWIMNARELERHAGICWEAYA